MKKLSLTTLEIVYKFRARNFEWQICIPEHGFYKFAQKDFKYHLMSDLIFFQLKRGY